MTEYEYDISQAGDYFWVRERKISSDDSYIYWRNCVFNGMGPYFYDYDKAVLHILVVKKSRGEIS